MTLRLYFEIW